jgi:beta-N-acetylhexosaminidase
MVDLTAAPFALDDAARQWVQDTLASLTLEEKVGQLFCEIVWERDGADPGRIFDVISPGAVMYRPFSGRRMREMSVELQARSTVPLLVACNLERGGSGGNGGLTDGTYVASPMGVAATGDPVHAYRYGLVAGREGAAAGINWTFGPIVDLDLNPHNPITNVRSYGSDVERVIAMAKGYIDGCRDSGLAVTIKHFPGDGVDFRDQHLMATVNSLSVADWHATYGRVYRELIDHGATAVMSAHIKQPALSQDLDPSLSEADVLPGSLSPELNQVLLRQHLGFNGVIVTDATQMVGFSSAMPRALAVPSAIAAGCDMFLFTINQREDVGYMLDGVRDGVVGADRLDEAVTRILAMKASLGLHLKQREGRLVPPEAALEVLRCDEHLEWAADCADKAVTLVKDRQGLLPIGPDRQRRIELIVATNEDCTDGWPAEVQLFKELLEAEGFAVDHFAAAQHPGAELSIQEYRSRVDLVVYYANMKVSSNQTSVRLTWSDFLGDDSPKYVRDVPTLFVSFSNPYHLVDVPMVQTYVNAYSSNAHVVRAVVAKLLGRSPFLGDSPVDPFAGLWDARL